MPLHQRWPGLPPRPKRDRSSQGPERQRARRRRGGGGPCATPRTAAGDRMVLSAAVHQSSPARRPPPPRFDRAPPEARHRASRTVGDGCGLALCHTQQDRRANPQWRAWRVSPSPRSHVSRVGLVGPRRPAVRLAGAAPICSGKMSLPYKQYVCDNLIFARATAGWLAGEPGDPPVEHLQKPRPYNSFDWTDDGCSGREQIGTGVERLSRLFIQPCGNMTSATATRQRPDARAHRAQTAWVDSRFLAEMKRLCTNSFTQWWQIANKRGVPLTTADVVHGAIHRLSNWSAPLSPPPSAPISGRS